MITNISEKQAFGMVWWGYPHYKDYRRVIYNGAIRSGKTFFGIRSFYHWALNLITTKYENNRPDFYADFLCIATTKENIKENAIEVLMRYLSSLGYYQCKNILEIKKGKFRYYDNAHLGYLYIKYGTHIMRFKYLGANNKRATNSIQGKTRHGVFIDEGALIDEVILETAEGRCASFKDDYKIFITTNPEGGEDHWFYKKYINKKRYSIINGIKTKENLVISYTMLDNPEFNQSDIDRYRHTFTPSMFLRKVLGKWVKGIGSIYKKFNKKDHVFDIQSDFKYYEYKKFDIGVDYGDNDATVFTLKGLQRNRMDIIKTCYHKNDEYSDKDINDYAQDFIEFIRDCFKMTKKTMTVYVDSANLALYKILRKLLIKLGITFVILRKTNKATKLKSTGSAITERIEIMNLMLGFKFIRIDKSCTQLISAIENSKYNDKGVRLDDKTVDVDSLDSCEYSWLEDIRFIHNYLMRR